MNATTAPTALEPARAWHALAADQVLASLGTSAQGLSIEEAGRRLTVNGANEFAHAERESLFRELGEALFEPLQLLLIAVGVLSLIFGELRDAIAIFAIIAAVAAIETVTELRARRALDGLKALAAPQARVVREGQSRVVAARELVPGDVVVVETGDLVPADCRVLAADSLATDESALTGEPEPAAKGVDAVAENTDLAERSSLMFAGTPVVSGEGRAVVVATGTATEVGQLGRMVAEEEEPATPLQRSMAELARVILLIAIPISVLVPAVGYLRGQPFTTMLLAGLTIAFATIPEELPILVSVLLAVGGRRLARRGALLRRLRAGETIGAVTVVLTDKTGTLTENQLRLERLEGPRDPARGGDSDAGTRARRHTGRPDRTRAIRSRGRHHGRRRARRVVPLRPDPQADEPRLARRRQHRRLRQGRTGGDHRTLRPHTGGAGAGARDRRGSRRGGTKGDRLRRSEPSRCPRRCRRGRDRVDAHRVRRLRRPASRRGAGSGRCAARSRRSHDRRHRRPPAHRRRSRPARRAFMDFGASVAFVSEPTAPQAMRQPPRAPGRRFLDRAEVSAIALVGFALFAGVLAAFLLVRARYGADYGGVAAFSAWLVGHAAVAWMLRARPLLALTANLAFPIWAAAAAATALVLGSVLAGQLGLAVLPASAWALVAAAGAASAALATVGRRALRISEGL